MTLKDTVRIVGNLMELAARTAPKAVGQDYIETILLTDEQRVSIGNEMFKIAEERENIGWKRDGQNVLDAEAVILIGLLSHKGVGLDCRACGYSSCNEFNQRSIAGDFDGPNCAIRCLDLGIALGSAAKIASDMNVDNRIMYRIGVAAKRLGIGKAVLSHGIPLSATGKNIFFDRRPKG
ncbi:MAG: hypothetical protein GX369_05200 [Euryarchaeota archaeon]|nr:hypothetical protein [Euryarchaeota archaeon]